MTQENKTVPNIFQIILIYKYGYSQLEEWINFRYSRKIKQISHVLKAIISIKFT